ncbi:MAG: LuxR C-terminal-related transcriptional regulator, partial [Ktedonobacteraceae bacterium]
EGHAEAHALSSRSVFSGQEQPLSNHLARLLYRSAQEALARVTTHAGARRLRFSFDYRQTEVVMSIEDDGVPSNAELLFEHTPGEALAMPPFLETEQTTSDVELANAVMHRLRGMVESMGGMLTLNSGLEQGTQVQVHLPYQAQEPREERPEPAVQTTIANPAVKISVLIVASQAVSRAGLHRLLESYPDLDVVGEAADSMQAVSETAELLPQVVLIDAQLPGEQTLETLRQLRQLNPAIHVLLLADREREELLYEALRAGASGYILKDIAPDELAHAVRLVARGEMLVQPHMATRLLARLGGHERASQESLTARERDVLQLLARGLRNKEIAARLIVSERTVNFHLANIYAKLHVSGRTEALSKALERGLLKV